MGVFGRVCFGLTVCFTMVSVLPAAASWPEGSLRPILRPDDLALQTLPRETDVPVYYAAKIRPILRPGSARPTGAVAAPATTPVDPNVAATPKAVPMTVPVTVSVAELGPGLRRSLRPLVRPRNLVTVSKPQSTSQPTANTTAKTTTAASGRVGKICGNRHIQGQRINAIPGKLRGCGVGDPVRVSSVSGVALSTPAIMDCNTANALKTWIDDGAKPAVGRLGGGLASIKVAAHYACRTRNNQPGAKISEHGRGKAIDISAITLNNGKSITVLKGWNDRAEGKVLRRMHRAACGPFGTVLGPDSDRFHKDHFHFDTANHRGGSYCR